MTQGASRPSWRTLLACSTSALVAGAFLGVWVAPEVRDVRDSGEQLSRSTSAPMVERVRDETPASAPQNSSRAPARFPTQIKIPAIGVTAHLQRLGLRPDRTVQVPRDPDWAGWFRRGPVPGQVGSAVILGHVDSVDGPAVFARLHELRPGHTVLVARTDGSVTRFVVTRTATYPNAAFPARRVYARQGAVRLNLVTCTGAYDDSRGGYQSNLVVYTKRVARST